MRLPFPPDENTRQAYGIIEREDRKNQKIDRDIELGDRLLYIKDTNGTRYSLTMGTDGVLTATIVPTAGRAFDTSFGVGYG